MSRKLRVHINAWAQQPQAEINWKSADKKSVCHAHATIVRRSANPQFPRVRAEVAHRLRM